ncbi:MAG: hypothetical protein V4598_06370 [Bdellovibrionota bacterium]
MQKVFLILLTLVFISCGDSHIVNDSPSRLDPLTGECELYFKTEDLCLKAAWELMPTSSDFGSMILTFTDLKNPGVLVAPIHTPFVVLWMTSMGHGSSPVSVENLEPGKFRIKDVFFIMPGPWDIKYQLKDGELVVDEVVQKIEV